MTILISAAQIKMYPRGKILIFKADSSDLSNQDIAKGNQTALDCL